MDARVSAIGSQERRGLGQRWAPLVVPSPHTPSLAHQVQSLEGKHRALSFLAPHADTEQTLGSVHGWTEGQSKDKVRNGAQTS